MPMLISCSVVYKEPAIMQIDNDTKPCVPAIAIFLGDWWLTRGSEETPAVGRGGG